MLEVKHLNTFFDDYQVLHDISLSVKKGECLCLLGPNGCGKTTLLKSIAGLLPYQGTVILDGVNLKELSRKQIASKMSFMSQITQVYFPYTIYQAVMLGRYQYMKKTILGSSPSKEDEAIVNEWLEKTGLDEMKDKKLDELSGGQLQRVFLAQTMVQQPDIILLDEPTNHLDIKNQIELIQELKKYSKENNVSVIGVFHDINLALNLTDNVLFLKQGHIQGYGKAKDIITPNFLKNIYDVDIAKYMIDSLSKWEEIVNKKEDK